MKNTRSFHGTVAKNYGPPTEQQLAKINSRLEKHLSVDDVFVFRAVASNRQRDSYYSIMGDSSLRNYAADYSAGRSFMNNHKVGERATGRTFDAEFNSDTGEVIVWTYTVRGLKLNEVSTDDFIRGVESGLIQDVSIHFQGGEDMCNVCNKRLYTKGCRHLPGIEYEDENTHQTRIADFTIEDAHAVELSDAWKGSNPDAGILRKAALLKRSGDLDDGMMRQINSRFGMNLRGILEGEEYLQFDWEDSDASDDDEVTLADGNTGSDGDGPNDPNPVTGLKKNNPVSDTKVTDKSLVDGRGVNKDMTKEERAAAIKLHNDLLEKRGAELDAEYVAAIKVYLREMEEGKDPMPPVDKSKAKKPDDDDKDDRSYLVPTDKEATVISCIRAMGDKMMPGKVNEGAMKPGQMDKAGMIMPGTEPLKDVASKGFSTSDGEVTPSEADLVKGLTDLNSPLLAINPEGIVSFFFGGQSTTLNGGVGVGDGGALYVTDRTTVDGKETVRVYQPIISRLDDPETVRALFNMAMDGQRLRGALYHSLVRYGCIVQGNKFDSELYLGLAREMSTDRLETFVKDWKSRAQEHVKTYPQESMSESDFTEVTVKSRQTVAKGGRSDDPKSTFTPPSQRNELFQL